MIVQEGPEEVILGLLLWSQREFSPFTVILVL